MLVCLCVTLTRHPLKPSWGGKDFFQFTTPRSQSVTERSQGRNLEVGTEAETPEKHCLLTACFLLVCLWTKLEKCFPNRLVYFKLTGAVLKCCGDFRRQGLSGGWMLLGDRLELYNWLIYEQTILASSHEQGQNHSHCHAFCSMMDCCLWTEVLLQLLKY